MSERPGRPLPPVGDAGSTVVRFPGRSARQRRAARWAIGAGVAALLALVAWILFFSPVLAVDRVSVTGTRLVDRADVERRLEPLRGEPLPRIGTGRVEGLLADVPGIAEVRSVAQPPTGVEVVVREETPVARKEAGDGVDVLLADGSVLSGIADEAPGVGALPSMADPLPGGDEAVRAEAARVLTTLPDAVRSRVETVGAGTPGQVRLGLDGGTVLVWGDDSHADLKGDVVEAFLDEDGGGPDLRRVKELDVTVPERPITR